MSPRYQVLIIGAVLVALALFSYLFVAYLLPLPDGLADKENIPATKIFDRHGTLLYEVLRPETGKVTIIPLQNIPEKFIKATLAAEDANYYSHPGVDFLAIGRAILFNVREQRVVSGASTITQQLVRNMMGDGRSGIGDGSAGGSGAGGSAGGGAGSGAGGSAGGSGAGGRGLTDKMMEALYAVRMSHMYSKDRILELYLNKIYYGNMSYGAQSAATDYFGRNLSDLDLAQSSLLAGLPQSPSSYNPYLNFNKAKKRQKYVLDRMVENDFITREEADAAYEQPIYLRGNKHPMKAPHFVRQVMNRIEADYGAEALFYGGLTVITTLDYDLQMKAERIVKRQVAFLARNNVTNAALVALDPKTAQVLAWVGSADYFNDEIAGSVDIITSLRQPGSSIKPLTYLAALEKGWTPATVIYDIPTQFNTESGPYSPKNYDLRYHGPVRARVALASSYNIPAVKTLEFVGLENFISFLGRLGIGTLDRPAGFYGLALTLGGGEVRVIDMANAFNVIANYGVKKPHSMILDVGGILDVEGILDVGGIRSIERILDVDPTSSIDYILGPNGRQHAYQIIDILKDPNARIPGFGEGSVLELSRPAAVKTGTTRNYRDNWTIGFTPDLLVAVWAGNADASPMQNISGVDGAAPIWAEFMEAALQGRPKTDFERPAGLVEMEICALSGKLPTDLCPDRAYEIFARGEEPKEPDDYYKSFNLNVNTGRVIRGECAGAYGSTLSRVVMVDYPRELRKWAAAENLPLPEYEPCSQARGGAGEYAEGYAAAYPSEQPDAISIDSPANNDEYLLDSSLPLNDQKIPFRVTVPAGTVTVSYYIAPPILDVAPISSIDPILDVAPISSIGKAPFTYLWPPVKGRHALTAVAETDTGEKSSATVTFIIK